MIVTPSNKVRQTAFPIELKVPSALLPFCVLWQFYLLWRSVGDNYLNCNKKSRVLFLA